MSLNRGRIYVRVLKIACTYALIPDRNLNYSTGKDAVVSHTIMIDVLR